MIMVLRGSELATVYCDLHLVRFSKLAKVLTDLLAMTPAAINTQVLNCAAESFHPHAI